MSVPASVTIVGGGASGTLVAVQLLRRLHPRGLRIRLVERRDRIGPGLAYSTSEPMHRLNVPARDLGAFPRNPDHFLSWARGRGLDADGGDFLPRGLYGEYLESLLDAAERAATPGAILERIRDEAVRVRIEPGASPISVTMRSGERHRGDRLVLALGNPRPAVPRGTDSGLLADSRFHADPWDPALPEAVARDRSVLLVGTGLTMIDIALTIASAAPKARITAVSRNGQLPRRHAAAPKRPPSSLFELTSHSITLDELVSKVEQEMDETEAAGGDWRTVIDSLRPITNRLWRRLPGPDQDRFLREVARHWEVRRHRMAPEVAAALDELTASGRLTVRQGSVDRLRAAPEGLIVGISGQDGPGRRLVRVDRVVNCTGPSLELERSDDALVNALLVGGIVRPGPLDLGLDHDSRGALLDGEGVASPLISAIGPVRKGRLWETTAIPEIRSQAAELADRLTAELGALSSRLDLVPEPLPGADAAVGDVQ